MPWVNHARQMAHREELLRLTGLHRLAQRLLADDALPAAIVSAGVRSAAEAAIALDQLRLAQAQRPTPLFRARILRLNEEILAAHPLAQRRPAVPSLETRRNAIFDAVAEAVAMDMPMPA